LHELAAEHQRERPLVKQVVALEADPALTAIGHNPCGHQAVQVEVGLEFLVPGVQDGQKARSAAELILGKFQQCLGDGGEQAVEHQPFVIQDHAIELMRQGEDHMEVWDRQDLLLAFG